MRIHSRFRTFSLFAAAAGLALPGPAWAQTDSSGTFKTGEELYAACTSSDDADVAECDWYIMGVHDAIVLHQDLEWVDTTICVPDQTTAETLRGVVIDYLSGSDDRAFTAVSMVYNSLEDSYACGGVSKK
jgi:hypothetical protein